MLDAVLPDLTFTNAKYAQRQIPLDLRWLLYSGASAINMVIVAKKIAQGNLGAPLLSRLPLVVIIHGYLEGKLAEGRSQVSLFGEVRRLREFYAYVDGLGDGLRESPTVENAQRLFRMYGEHLSQRPGISPHERYEAGLRVARCLSPAVEKPVKLLMRNARLQRPKTVPGTRKADKQSLADVASFVRFLGEVCVALPQHVVLGPVPTKLTFSDGSSHTVLGGFKMGFGGDSKYRSPKTLKEALQARERVSQCQSLERGVRALLANMRIEAELLIFIHQTGANLAQTRQLVNGEWSYQSRHDYLEMTAFKGRAGKQVSYRVYPEYRHHFEAYLAWRNALFPDVETRLFPILMPNGGSHQRRQFHQVTRLSKALKRSYYGPQILRRTHGNWKERQKAGSGHLELGNSARVFDVHYRESNAQQALVEINRYWRGRRTLAAAAGAGGCVKPEPTLQHEAPSGAPQPDCHSAGGCAFCEHNRDLESFDHVWNLASLRALAIHELTVDATPGGRSELHPKVVLIERLGAKLEAFRELGGQWTNWIAEADRRVAAEYYHTMYREQWNIITGAKELT